MIIVSAEMSFYTDTNDYSRCHSIKWLFRVFFNTIEDWRAR